MNTMKFDFNTLEFETLDANVNAYPDIYINVNAVTFTKKVVEDLGYPANVLFQLDAKNKVFAVRACKSNEARSFKFSKPRGEQKSTISISSRNLTEPLRAVMKNDWESGKRYRVRGFWVAEAKTMCFDLTEAVQESFRRADVEEEAES